MGGRKHFFSIFSKDPPAIDVIREELLLNETTLEVGSECIFRWERVRDQFENVSGIVKVIGLKKECLAYSFGADGQRVASKEGVGTRRQELEKRRLEQVHAQQLQLLTVAQQIQTGGVDAAIGKLQPQLRTLKKVNLPCKRGNQVLSKIAEILKNMPCFIPGGNKSRLITNQDIFCHSGRLMIAKLKYSKKPVQLHRTLLKLCVSQRVLTLDGVSATGKRGCVAINPLINETIVMYVHGVCKAAGVTAQSLIYDPQQVLKNVIDNTRRVHGTWRIEQEQESQEVDAPQQEPEALATASSSSSCLPSSPCTSSNFQSSPSASPQHFSSCLFDISFNRPVIAERQLSQNEY